MKDKLGDRMKEQYENRTRYLLPRRTYTIIRVDGKAFHSLTKSCERPFDKEFHNAMIKTAQVMLSKIQGSQFAFVQSDEISILVTDFNSKETEAYLNGNIQKLASVSAGIASAYFNRFFNMLPLEKIAIFDSRVFTIPDSVEVENYFIWRQKDAFRNGISMIAQSLFSHKKLQNKNIDDMIKIISNTIPGKLFCNYIQNYCYGHLITKENPHSDFVLYNNLEFVENRSKLEKLIPHHGY